MDHEYSCDGPANEKSRNGERSDGGLRLPGDDMLLWRRPDCASLSDESMCNTGGTTLFLIALRVTSWKLFELFPVFTVYLTLLHLSV